MDFMDELHDYAEAERQKIISWAEKQNECAAELAGYAKAELKALAWERRPFVHRRVLNPVQTLLAARN